MSYDSTQSPTSDAQLSPSSAMAAPAPATPVVVDDDDSPRFFGSRVAEEMHRAGLLRDLPALGGSTSALVTRNSY